MKVLLSAQQLQAGVVRMADEINACYGRRPVTIIGVMTGSLILLADLVRLLRMPLRLGVMQARSYQGDVRGELSVDTHWLPELAERDVLLIDDILDTGHTLQAVLAQIRQLGPESLRSAVLLKKQGRQQVAFEPDFVGFEIPDEFVVGYGLDYRDEYRHLPYLAALEPDDMTSEPR